MILPRYYNNLEAYLKTQKVLVLYGPRQVGKTTLLKQFLGRTSLHYRLDSGDNIRVHHILGSRDFSQIKEYAEGYELIVIDEAQQIPHIGDALKILVDQVPGITIIVTGSSTFELARQVGEPLTGRKRTLTLYPMAQLELRMLHNNSELREKLEEYLIFGSYPEILTASSQKEQIRVLEELVSSFLLKDILTLEKVKGSKVILDLLALLAFQVGNLVSHNELASQLHINVRTVERYLDLLEKSFVIITLGSLSRNLRNEISKKKKYYFLDNGIRNAVIQQFNPFNLRQDRGALWENFLFMERLKMRSYIELYRNVYFWRTHEGREIDYVEEGGGALKGYEFKWSKKKERLTAPPGWMENYPGAVFQVVTPRDYIEFVAPRQERE
jgi:uncharacterized protein